MEIPVIDPAARSAGCASGGCGTAQAPLTELPAHIRNKIEDHPCFSDEAHRFFARMHVAVAPACNIQCNYCNRKYNCANESRPGVVSEVLTPEQAFAKVMAVSSAIPQTSVIGIAGPGDALANPERTFATFRLLSAQAPDLKLCLSTNGLRLPEAVDEIARHNIDHVTITINCLDPQIGARIYPWIYWQNRRLRGVEATRILIEQQLQGLELLTARGILVKINSVLIPGINDAHLPDVARAVRERGAFLHNIMPLISDPAHGTYFGVMGQPAPTAADLEAVQAACGGDMKLMRHCRQCRADAVGLLGEDRGAEFSRERIAGLDIDPAAAMARRVATRAALLAEMAVQRQTPPTAAPVVFMPRRPQAPSAPAVLFAVATGDGAKAGIVAEHFGHARAFAIYAADADGVRFVERRQVELYCSGEADCGETESKLERTIRTLAGCAFVLCARIGIEPWGKLEAAGIRPNAEHALEPVEAAVAAVYAEAGRQRLAAVEQTGKVA